MKTKSFFLILLFIILNNRHYAYAQDADFDIYGIYLPVEYIETLERTKHNPTAWGVLNKGNPYNFFYIVKSYHIEAHGMGYERGYPLFLSETLKFRFEKTGDDVYLVDHLNNRFKKIPGDLFESENYNAAINNFIGNIILDELIKSGDIILENDLVTFPLLDNKVFRIEWQSFNPRAVMHLVFEEVTDNQKLSLHIRSNEYTFYRSFTLYSADIVLRISL